MWEDMVLYWAWRGKEVCNTDPPTKKRLVYAKIKYPVDKLGRPPKGQKFSLRLICYGVYDDDKFTEVNNDEINWHKNQGATITWEK